MPTETPVASSVLRKLISDGLFDRLPVTFTTFFFDQIKDWQLLFPAERGYFERLFSLIARSDAEAVNQLFEPMRQAERKMGVNEKIWPRREFTLDQVDFLNRSPHYPEWRAAVSSVFAKLDPILDEETARQGRPRLAIVLAPAELPVGSDRMWLRVARYGKRVRIKAPGDPVDWTALLMTGAASSERKPSIADLFSASGAASRYDCWIIEAGSNLPVDESHKRVQFSYDRLEAYRSRLMRDVNRAVEQEQIRGPRQLGARLKQMKLLESESAAAKDPILAEFARAVLLTGNGTLLINNTFVEWSTVQAVRRARPSLVITSFGIRNKMKPFSSLLIYADQEKATPIPTQMDTLGTYVDLEVFYQYIWQEFEKYAEYRRNTVFLFGGVGMDEMLVIAPPDFELLKQHQPVDLPTIFAHARDWVGV